MRHGTVSAGAAVLSSAGAALSWLCCLPVFLGGLGAGTAMLAGFLGPMRPYLAFGSLALLGAAFFGAYRPQEATAQPSPEHRGRLRRRRGLLWLAALVALAFVSVPYWLDWVIYWSL